LLLRFADDAFDESHLTTIGVDFKVRTVCIGDKTVKLQVWDTAGQETFRTITSNYYRGAHGILLVYDVTDRNSFTAIQRWLDEVKQYASEDADKQLVGNKIDMEERRQVSSEEGERLASERNMPFLETSAKSATRVQEAFLQTAERLAERRKGCTQGLDGDRVVVPGVPLKPSKRKLKLRSCCGRA
jgi:Ras-related protein Rab-1A